MKVTRLVFAIILLSQGFLKLTGQNELHILFDLEELVCKEQESASHSHHFHPQGSRNATASQTDIYYQSMHWEIDPAVRYISGEITYHFKSKVENLTELVLDFSHELQVNSIQRGGTVLQYGHTSDHLLTIFLDKTLSPGQSDTLTITYEGIPDSNGFGSFELATHDGKPILWTLSEPYGIRDWWPCKQDLIDKIDSVDIYITTPMDQLAASNGKLVSIDTSGDRLIHHWQHRYPIASYLIALAVTNYTSYSHLMPLVNGDTLEILNYVYPESLTQAQVETPAVLEILSLYNELFGTYPFASEKYGYAQFNWGGGMEHQTMSFMVNFSYGLQAHETAHQWFGDKVTCGSWTDIWLNEGFATYLTGLSMERYSHEQYWPIWKSATSNSATNQPGGSVFVDDTTNINRIFSSRLTYNKGAYLLHMLRWVTGDTAFFQACRDYLNHPDIAYEFARTEDLQYHLEQRSGKDLEGFFADWFYGQGYPAYNLQWSHQQDSVVFWLSQQPSHASVSFFEMPVPIRISQGGYHQTFVLDHTLQNQRFAFYSGGAEIDSVRLDPDIWLLSRNNVITELTTSTYDPIGHQTVQIYPNPAENFVEIMPAGEISRADLIDVFGRVHELQMASNRIDLSLFESGYFILVLKNNHDDVLSINPLMILK